MKTATIDVDPEEAARKLGWFREEQHSDSQEFTRACEEGYAALAEGHTLIHLSRSVRGGGLGEDGRPRLAIARADTREVFFQWRHNNPIATYYCGRDRSWNAATRWPGLIRSVRMDTTHQDREHGYLTNRCGYALVPAVPADVRPQTGRLKDWYILWEVDEWSDESRFMPPPTDPYLLRHLRGELYIVLAEWNLTELEKAVMEEFR